MHNLLQTDCRSKSVEQRCQHFTLLPPPAASATLNKKSFDIELQQQGNNGTKKLNWPVLGMPADNDWVL